jgi:hypothetical protein
VPQRNKCDCTSYCCYHSVQLKNIEPNHNVFVGTNLSQELWKQFSQGRDLLVVFKLILLQRKIVLFARSGKAVSNAILSILSLLPGYLVSNFVVFVLKKGGKYL